MLSINTICSSSIIIQVSTKYTGFTVTSTGRATCNRLDLNDERHNEGSIIKARRLWIQGGWYPPDEDPRQV